jgi:four helix bundle protein
MSKANSFEDLRVWQLARELVRAVYLLTNEAKFDKDWALKDQLRRAAVSSMANIAEGFERGSTQEFIRFLYIARGSAGEVRSHLYVARDLEYIEQPSFERIQKQAISVSRVIYSFIRSLESSKIKAI